VCSCSDSEDRRASRSCALEMVGMVTFLWADVFSDALSSRVAIYQLSFIFLPPVLTYSGLDAFCFRSFAFVDQFP